MTKVMLIKWFTAHKKQTREYKMSHKTVVTPHLNKSPCCLSQLKSGIHLIRSDGVVDTSELFTSFFKLHLHDR